jgi:hypothetical protein
MDARKFHKALMRAFMTPIWMDEKGPEHITVSLSHWDEFKKYWCEERGVTVEVLEDGSVVSPFEKSKLIFAVGIPDDVVIVPGLGAPLSQFLNR